MHKKETARMRRAPLKPGTSIQIIIKYPGDVVVKNLSFRCPDGTVRNLYAQDAVHLFTGDRTEATLKGLSLDVPDGTADPDGDLAELLSEAVRYYSGYEVMSDCEINGCGVPLPNVPFDRVILKTPASVLFDARSGGSRAGMPVIETHPLTPHMTVNPLEREIVSYRLSSLISEAISEYDDDIYHGEGKIRENWPIEEFIAEYIMQRGAWTDVNYDRTLARPTEEWTRPED